MTDLFGLRPNAQCLRCLADHLGVAVTADHTHHAVNFSIGQLGEDVDADRGGAGVENALEALRLLKLRAQTHPLGAQETDLRGKLLVHAAVIGESASDTLGFGHSDHRSGNSSYAAERLARTR